MTTAPTIADLDTPRSVSWAPSAVQKVGRRLLQRAIGRLRFGSVTVVDGEGVISSEAPDPVVSAPECIVRVHDPRVYSAVALGGGVALSEAYMDGLWETDDLPGLVETMTVNLSAAKSLEGTGARALQMLERARYRLSRNTRRGSRRNIHAHYDLGNPFFALFLDPSMTYSSGIFENGAETLEEAQIEKLDRVCRKLDLRPGDRVLEIGTGWGSFALHAAARYGCRVTTTTISSEQATLARQRVRDAGLSDRVSILEQDYRDLRGRFDKLVSIEMVEAVGAERVPEFFGCCSRLLEPTGAMLLQAIVIRDQFFSAAARRVDFLKKYIFPGSCLLSVGSMADAIGRRTDLRQWHCEDFGPHYARTLSVWRERFLGRIDEVRALGYDRRFERMWEYYLSYCEGVFRARHAGVVQLLLTKPLCRLAPASPSVAPGRGSGGGV